MIIHEIHDLSNIHVIQLLENEFSKISDAKIIENYHPKYSNQKSNIFYLLETGRYSKEKGKYFVVENDMQFVTSSGWNEYNYDSEIALLLTRSYTSIYYRSQFIMGNELLKKMLDETANYCKRWITVNESNKKIYKWFSKVAYKKDSSMRYWPEIYKSFYPVGLKHIYFTDQYVLEYKDNHD